jgi:hypothetical protein
MKNEVKKKMHEMQRAMLYQSHPRVRQSREKSRCCSIKTNLALATAIHAGATDSVSNPFVIAC